MKRKRLWESWDAIELDELNSEQYLNLVNYVADCIREDEDMRLEYDQVLMRVGRERCSVEHASYQLSDFINDSINDWFMDNEISTECPAFEDLDREQLFWDMNVNESLYPRKAHKLYEYNGDDAIIDAENSGYPEDSIEFNDILAKGRASKYYRPVDESKKIRKRKKSSKSKKSTSNQYYGYGIMPLPIGPAPMPHHGRGFNPVPPEPQPPMPGGMGPMGMPPC